MNRPMTSPWSLVLTSSPTITFTPNSRGLLARLERPGDLVVVGHRDRSEAALAGGGEQHLDRRHAVVGVIGVHVQVDVDQPAAGEAVADGVGPRLGGSAQRGELAVDRLGLVGDAAPREVVAGCGGALAQRGRAIAGRARRARAGRPARRRRRARTAARARRRRGPPRRRAAARRPARRRRRARARAGRRGHVAERRRDDHVGVGEHLALGRVVGRQQRQAVAQRGCAARRSGRRRWARRRSPPTRHRRAADAARAGRVAAPGAPPGRRTRTGPARRTAGARSCAAPGRSGR